MHSFKRWSTSPLRAIRTRPWPESTAATALLDESNLVEEEKTPSYDSKLFYAARLGEILNARYQLATKAWIWHEFYCVACKGSISVSMTLLCTEIDHSTALYVTSLPTL
jgi:hypothetical protein